VNSGVEDKSACQLRLTALTRLWKCGDSGRLTDFTLPCDWIFNMEEEVLMVDKF